MTTQHPSEFNQLAGALAALLAAWWRHHDRNDEAAQAPEPIAQSYLARLEETTAQARAPPGGSLNCKTSCRKNAIIKKAK